MAPPTTKTLTEKSIYWQYNKPLNCPEGHEMLWLGSAFWICGKGKCNRIYVQDVENSDLEGEKSCSPTKSLVIR